jgi:hypothetical protein
MNRNQELHSAFDQSRQLQQFPEGFLWAQRLQAIKSRVITTGMIGGSTSNRDEYLTNPAKRGVTISFSRKILTWRARGDTTPTGSRSSGAVANPQKETGMKTPSNTIEERFKRLGNGTWSRGDAPCASGSLCSAARPVRRTQMGGP